MESNQYKILLEAIRKVDKRINDLEKVTNDIKKDIGDDRVKIDNVVLAQDKLNGSIQVMRGDTNNLSKRTEEVVKDAMTSVLKPAVKEVSNLTDEIHDKKMIAIKKVNLWDFLRFKVKKTTT